MLAFEPWPADLSVARRRCEIPGPRGRPAIADLLPDVIEAIAIARARAPLAPGALRQASTGGFLRAVDLVMAPDPVARRERSQRTLQVPPELARKNISVLRETDW